MTKLMLVLAIAGSAMTLAPQPVAASGCTDDYVKCLNDTHALQVVLRTMADVECFADYIGCVRSGLNG